MSIQAQNPIGNISTAQKQVSFIDVRGKTLSDDVAIFLASLAQKNKLTMGSGDNDLIQSRILAYIKDHPEITKELDPKQSQNMAYLISRILPKILSESEINNLNLLDASARNKLRETSPQAASISLGTLTDPEKTRTLIGNSPAPQKKEPVLITTLPTALDNKPDISAESYVPEVRFTSTLAAFKLAAKVVSGIDVAAIEKEFLATGVEV